MQAILVPVIHPGILRNHGTRRTRIAAQYAREQVSPDLWTRPEFVRINYVITATWAPAFAVLVLAELTLLYLSEVPPRVGILATIAALVSAVKFTSWYPEHRKPKRQ